MHVPNVLASVALPPTWLAAVLLLGRAIAQRHELPCASGNAIVMAIGASKGQAYEVAGELAALLPTLVRTPGRPTKEEPAPPSSAPADVMRATLAYVMSHPGCVDRGAKRQRYSVEFRRFVLCLHLTHASLELEAFADGVGVPLGTLKDWLRAPCASASPEDPTSPPPSAQNELETLHIQSVLDAWTRWQGSFLDFCAHVQRDLRVPFARDLVRRILQTHGRRATERRTGRGPDELALRGAFHTYFPGAQWADGDAPGSRRSAGGSS